MTRRSPRLARRASGNVADDRPARAAADQRLLAQSAAADDRAGTQIASSAAPVAASGSSARIAGFANSSSPRGLTIATASSRCSTADSRLATWPAICERSADSCALTALKKVPSSPNSSSLIEVEPDAELAAAQPRQAAADDVNRPQQQLREQHRADDRHGQRDDGRHDARAERRVQILPDQQRRDADADRAEIGVAEQQRLRGIRGCVPARE